MTTEPVPPDLSALHAALDLPPPGVRLDTAQALRLIAALHVDCEPIPEHAWTWARRVLGVDPGTPDPGTA